jgi:vacuolar-type H+-ATPase subunit H
MEKISEAVVSKVKLDAQNIIREAEEKAQEEIEKAKRQRKVRLEEERGKMLGECESRRNRQNN